MTIVYQLEFDGEAIRLFGRIAISLITPTNCKQYGIGWASGNVSYAPVEFAGYVVILACGVFVPETQ
jgi:hypothetical protein